MRSLTRDNDYTIEVGASEISKIILDPAQTVSVEVGAHYIVPAATGLNVYNMLGAA